MGINLIFFSRYFQNYGLHEAKEGESISQCPWPGWRQPGAARTWRQLRHMEAASAQERKARASAGCWVSSCLCCFPSAGLSSARSPVALAGASPAGADVSAMQPCEALRGSSSPGSLTVKLPAPVCPTAFYLSSTSLGSESGRQANMPNSLAGSSCVPSNQSQPKRHLLMSGLKRLLPFL